MIDNFFKELKEAKKWSDDGPVTSGTQFIGEVEMKKDGDEIDDVDSTPECDDGLLEY